jgi:hypothetical protein
LELKLKELKRKELNKKRNIEKNKKKGNIELKRLIR